MKVAPPFRRKAERAPAEPSVLVPPAVLERLRAERAAAEARKCIYVDTILSGEAARHDR